MLTLNKDAGLEQAALRLPESLRGPQAQLLSNSNFNLNLNIGDLSKFYGYLNAWFKNIYIDSKFHEIRKKEFDGKWKEWIWYLKSSKPRKKIMREHLAKELYNYVISGSADFSLSLSEEGEFKKCIGQLEEYAKQCAKEIFYNNELFDTRFKAQHRGYTQMTVVVNNQELNLSLFWKQ